MGASASAQSKAVSAILEADGMDFDDLAAAIGANAEASRIVGDVFVRMPPNVVTEVNARLGYVKEDQQAHHAALPPELQNFKVLAKYESVQVIFNNEDFASAVADVRILEFRRVELDKEEAAVEALSVEVGKLLSAFNAAVEAVGKVNVELKISLRRVVYAGNEDFLKVYNAMWAMIQKSEAEGCGQYREVLARVELPLDHNKNVEHCKQPTTDVASLYLQAAKTSHTFHELVSAAAARVEGVEVQYPQGLKNVPRIVEKMVLKYDGTVDQVCDIVRCMIVCPSMGHVALALAALVDDPKIKIVRVKDRYFNPSSGGWTDVLLNIRVGEHVCEVQIVHEQMLAARTGLPGHDVYNCVRNASELLGLLFPEKEQPQTIEELQKWLIEYHHTGDKFTRGHPNEWDVSKVTNMEKLLDRDELRDFNEDISKWDMGHVESTHLMFCDARAFNQPIGGWNTSKVEDMKGMFSGATSFNQPIGDWDTSSVESMAMMFYGAKAFNQPIGKWNTTNVKSMFQMLYEAEAFNQPIDRILAPEPKRHREEELDEDSEEESIEALLAEGSTATWNARNGGDSEVDRGAEKDSEKLLAKAWDAWDTSKVKTFFQMFYGATTFNQPIGNWDTSSAQSMRGMFEGAYAFNQPIEKWNTSNVWSMEKMFFEARAFNQPIGQWNTKNVDGMGGMFTHAQAFKQEIPDEWTPKGCFEKSEEDKGAGAKAFQAGLMRRPRI